MGLDCWFAEIIDDLAGSICCRRLLLGSNLGRTADERLLTFLKCPAPIFLPPFSCQLLRNHDGRRSRAQ